MISPAAFAQTQPPGPPAAAAQGFGGAWKRCDDRSDVPGLLAALQALDLKAKAPPGSLKVRSSTTALLLNKIAPAQLLEATGTAERPRSGHVALARRVTVPEGGASEIGGDVPDRALATAV